MGRGRDFCSLDGSGAVSCLSADANAAPLQSYAGSAYYVSIAAAADGDAGEAAFAQRGAGPWEGWGGNDTSGAVGWLGADSAGVTSGAAVSIGPRCALALLSNGSVVGVGSGVGGGAPLPAHCAAPDAPFVYVAVGSIASCGVGEYYSGARGGQVTCWGEGDGSTPPNMWQPPGDLGPQLLVLPSGGANYALDAHGNVSCWGEGCTQPTERLRLLQSDGEGGVCGITSNFSVLCWGGPLGNYRPGKDGQLFVQLVNSGGVFCALDSEGNIICFGAEVPPTLLEWVGVQSVPVPDVRDEHPPPPHTHTHTRAQTQHPFPRPCAPVFTCAPHPHPSARARRRCASGG
jgi:hypothetical protein